MLLLIGWAVVLLVRVATYSWAVAYLTGVDSKIAWAADPIVFGLWPGWFTVFLCNFCNFSSS